MSKDICFKGGIFMVRSRRILKIAVLAFTAIIILLVINVHGTVLAAEKSGQWRETVAEDGSEWRYWMLPDGTAEVEFLISIGKSDIVVPKYVDGHKVTRLTNECFMFYYDITSVTIPEGVKYIGECAFFDCIKLKEVNLPSTLEEIGEYAFKDCYKLKSVVIPSNVKKLGRYLFTGCKKLESVTISCKIKNIPEYTFNGCKSLKCIDIPYTVRNIGRSAFSECSSLSRVSIPSSVRKIDEDAFFNCSSLKNVNIPSSVKTISKSAFSGCKKLEKVYIYRNDVDLHIADKQDRYDGSSFEDCPKLTIVARAGSSAEKYAENQNVPFEKTTKLDDISTFDIQLSRDSYTYNGKAKRPSVVIKSNRGVLKESNYTIQYKNNVNPGMASVIITGKGRYTGTIKKRFAIRLATPKVSARSTSNGIRISWNKISGADGYYVYRKSGKENWEIIEQTKSAKRLYYIDKKAKSGKNYRYTVRAYKGTKKSKFKATKYIKK